MITVLRHLPFMCLGNISHLLYRVFQNILSIKKEEPKKKDPVKHESKLKAFIKRSSEPLLNMQNTQQMTKVRLNKYIRAIVLYVLVPVSYIFQPQPQLHQTLIIEEFEPDVFRQLIEYIHTGCVTLQPRTLLGE